jgi:hypothetical protein
MAGNHRRLLLRSDPDVDGWYQRSGGIMPAWNREANLESLWKERRRQGESDTQVFV